MDNNTQTKHSVTIFIVFLIPLLVISNLSLLIADMVNANQEEHPIMKNNYSVAGIPLENLSREKSIEVLEEAVSTIDQQQISIQFGEQEWIIAVADLHVIYDIPATVNDAFSVTSLSSRQHIPLVYQYDKVRLKKKLTEIADQVHVPAINAAVYKTGSRIEKSPEQIGQFLHIDNLILTIQDALANALLSNHFIITLNEIVPRIPMADVREVDRHFISYTTQVDRNDTQRLHNIDQAIARIEAFVANPGTSISFDELAGPYIADNGYTLASVNKNGEYTENYGGGVCQVASSLFVAALKAGLDIEEHHQHERPVEYVPLGYDATVIAAASDLKLVNTKRRNMYISINRNESEIQVDIYGNSGDYIPYSLQTRDKKSIQPDKAYHTNASLQPNAELVIANGEQGYTIDLYRLWSADNQRQEELIKNFYYPPMPMVIQIGEKHGKAIETSEGKSGN